MPWHCLVAIFKYAPFAWLTSIFHLCSNWAATDLPNVLSGQLLSLLRSPATAYWLLLFLSFKQYWIPFLLALHLFCICLFVWLRFFCGFFPEEILMGDNFWCFWKSGWLLKDSPASPILHESFREWMVVCWREIIFLCKVSFYSSRYYTYYYAF